MGDFHGGSPSHHPARKGYPHELETGTDGSIGWDSWMREQENHGSISMYLSLFYWRNHCFGSAEKKIRNIYSKLRSHARCYNQYGWEEVAMSLAISFNWSSYTWVSTRVLHQLTLIVTQLQLQVLRGHSGHWSCSTPAGWHLNASESWVSKIISKFFVKLSPQISLSDFIS